MPRSPGQLTGEERIDAFARTARIYLQNVSYLKLRELTVGMDLPPSWVSRIGVHSRNIPAQRERPEPLRLHSVSRDGGSRGQSGGDIGRSGSAVGYLDIPGKPHVLVQRSARVSDCAITTPTPSRVFTTPQGVAP